MWKLIFVIFIACRCELEMGYPVENPRVPTGTRGPGSGWTHFHDWQSGCYSGRTYCWFVENKVSNNTKLLSLCTALCGVLKRFFLIFLGWLVIIHPCSQMYIRLFPWGEQSHFTCPLRPFRFTKKEKRYIVRRQVYLVHIKVWFTKD